MKKLKQNALSNSASGSFDRSRSKLEYRIMFSMYNLFTRAESPVRLPMANRIRPDFLDLDYVTLSFY
ncbi:hypothetical protein [Leptospira noguchii]|uniref:hypothetical protein n=1 Tax=Leptospira noguchii TaxID=28182 RepID=UPI0012FAE856|nr:hypothetical protein [Leptospira noguchii]